MKNETPPDQAFLFRFKSRLILMLNWTLILGLLLSLDVSAKSYGQDVKVSLTLNGSSLKEAIGALEQKAQTRFMYSEDVLPKNKQVTLSVQNEELLNVLGKVLQNTGLTYKVTNAGLIVIAPEASGLADIKVKGKVTDDKGGPLPGVSIKVVGAAKGTVSNGNGEYELAVPDGGSIQFSYVGFATQTIAVAGRAIINVTLKDDANTELNEVVVVGYGTQRKSDLTGSVASLSGKDLDKTPVVGADQMLQGRVSGLQLTQSDGQPGNATSIRIRGTNSINSGNEPLYVIDGFAGVANLSSINPNDIQSIEVLKDASSTAIYGSRGANGVILVTTKKGKEGQNNINFDAYYGQQKLSKKMDMMNASQFAQYLNDYYTQYNAANPATQKALPYTNDQINSLGAGTDWQDELYRTAPIQSYQLSFSGGNKDTRYYLGLNHFDQDGIMRNTGFRRELIRMNLDRNIGNKIKVGFSSQISYSSQNIDATKTGVGYGAAGGALNMNPIVPLRDASGKYSFQNEPIPVVGVYGNPVAGVMLTQDNIGASRGLINAFGEYELIPGLKFKTSIGVDFTSGFEKRYLPSTVFIGQATVGQGYRSSAVNYSWLNENTLSYTKEFNKNHRIDALAGFSLQEFKTDEFSASSQNYFTDALGADNLSIGGNVLTPTSNAVKNNLASFFGRANYYYSDKYIFTFTMRADGSSRFGLNSKWGYFPSGAVAWRASNEDFLKDIKQISNLKLRASYGKTGNQEIPSYASLLQYGANGYSLGTAPVRVVGVSSLNIPNPKLAWESTQSFDFGLDLGLFKDRLSFVADYYRKTTTDLLLNVAIPQSSGFSTILLNAGKVQNHGLELSLNAKNIDNKDFTWSTTLNYSTNKNKVADMNGTNNIMVGSTGSYIVTNGLAPSILRVGQPIGSFYGYFSDGIWQTQQQIDAAGRKGVVPGDAIIRDLDGNGIINGDDRAIIGQAAPKFIYSINNNFSYKNFDLAIFMQGVQGNKILNITKYAHNGGTTNNQYVEMTGAWNGAGSTNELPRAYSTTERAAGVVSRYLEDGSYLRLQTVSLGYNIPVSKSKVFKTATVYVTGQNLWTITRYSGYSPEINSYDSRNSNSGSQNTGSQNLNVGADVNSYPPSRTFLLGAKIGF
ncbi:TonB-dependent receptor [Pedobacter sp. MC2016-24]|uniref:TonB-dependent receptor n=1 Tax=Pedobacter sp. MC2016-24 TaxID=2780090 RepID=UPI0018818E38|nr:TonB-dependent receptor [Pedobacter sp. MC2016-24]MBE9600216.1 TonB-dependent receptor [Pedobacter sp. MC2016-24]